MELLDFFVNPKDQEKNSVPVYAGFIDGNLFERMCEKHNGLFDKIKQDIRQLRVQRYSKAPENLKPSKLELIVEIKEYLKKEQAILKIRNYDNLTLEKLHGFLWSFINMSERL